MHCKAQASLTRIVTVAYSVPLLKNLPKVGSKLLSFFVCEILIVFLAFCTSFIVGFQSSKTVF